MKLERDLKKIAILRALNFGDLLCAIPAIRSLKKAYPSAKITLIGLANAKEFSQIFHKYIDDFIVFPGFPGLPEQKYNPLQFEKFVKKIKKEKFDLLIQMQGNGTVVNSLVTQWGAKTLAGCYTKRSIRPNKKYFMLYPINLPEIKRHMALMKFLGVKAIDVSLEFPLDNKNKFFLNLKKYICLHPGSRDKKRQVDPLIFARIGNDYIGRGFQIVLTGMKGEEEIGKKVEKNLEQSAINLIGKTNLNSWAQVFKNAHLVVTNDTGASHLAAALKVRSLTLSQNSDMARWAPLDKQTNITLEIKKSKKKIFTWNVHGNYLYYLSHAQAQFFIPYNASRSERFYGKKGLLMERANISEIPFSEVKNYDFDLILFQHEKNYKVDQFQILSQKQRQLPKIYLDHEPPRSNPTGEKHFIKDKNILLVFVTAFNKLMWDYGKNTALIVDHGVIVPDKIGYKGDLNKGVVVINNLKDRGRRLGLDIFLKTKKEIPLDLIGMGSEKLGGLGELKGEELLEKISHYRFLFNPIRYTSLGLSVIEAMMIGLPIVGLATTEVTTVIQNDHSGYIDTNEDHLIAAMKYLLSFPQKAKVMGAQAKNCALKRFNINRFASEWESIFNYQLIRSFL